MKEISLKTLNQLIEQYMRTNLEGLGFSNVEIKCEDMHVAGFSVCQAEIPAGRDDRDFNASRDWISNGVELPPGVNDFPVNNIFIKESNTLKYFVVVYWGDIL